MRKRSIVVFAILLGLLAVLAGAVRLSIPFVSGHSIRLLATGQVAGAGILTQRGDANTSLRIYLV